MGRQWLGEIGDGTTVPRFGAPVAVAGGRVFTQVTAGYDHGCGLLSSGIAYCWGNNLEGELGDSTTATRYVPTAVAGGRLFTQIASGSEYTCGLARTRRAYCWGANYIGQLGNNSSGRRANWLVPTAVAGELIFTRIVPGDDHTCGLTGAGRAYCWGRNTEGELGDGTKTDRLVPTAVAGGRTFALITAGYDHTCGLTSAGIGYCWGRNTHGEIGDSTTIGRVTPTAVAGGRIFTQIAGGGAHTCGLTSSGHAYCWGFNYDGRVGDSTQNNIRLAPTPVAGRLTFTQIVTGSDQTCGLTKAGAAYCWGSIADDQLGDGGKPRATRATRLVPTAIAGGLRFRSLSAGKFHTVGLLGPLDHGAATT